MMRRLSILKLVLTILIIASFSILRCSAQELIESGGNKISETWMGIYINGVKVGYSFSQEFSLFKNGKKYSKKYEMSFMKLSRLGSNPVELVTTEQTLYDENKKPVRTLIKTKMSETETIIKIEYLSNKIIFKSEKEVSELPYKGEFYLGVPIEKIIEEGKLKSGNKFNFKILDIVSRSIVDTSFEIIGKEEILILGRTMKLWHVKEDKSSSVLPRTVDEWIDDKGETWKQVIRSSFLTTTSIRMGKEKALEISEENFDIAFSTAIKSNIKFENPQNVQSITFKISGVSLNKIKNFPFDDGSQTVIDIGKDYAIIKTSSQIFHEKDAIPFPIRDRNFKEYLKSTSFCQSDDSEIKKIAQAIIGEKKNSWRAAKKIAEWVKREITPDYDIGFATAKEILKNRKGDCTEHTVIMVALCRAVGIPARAAVGIMYAHGIFLGHMWPEVYVGRWISLDAKWLAVDKKSSEYYTDATHIKFGRSNLDENIFKDMALAVSEIIGKLKLEILDYRQQK
jgi:transglutaminase-like putative cysteine protease